MIYILTKVFFHSPNGAPKLSTKKHKNKQKKRDVVNKRVLLLIELSFPKYQTDKRTK